MMQTFRELAGTLQRFGLRVVFDWYEITRFAPPRYGRFPQ
jgi:hypothetical protein